MAHTTVRDGNVGSIVATGVGHPDAPIDRPIGLQISKFNEKNQQYETIVLYLNNDEALELLGDLAYTLRLARRGGVLQPT